MRLFMFLLVLCLATGLVYAQTPGVVLPFPSPGLPVQSFQQLKDYLGLSDAQIQSLTDLLKSRNDAQQAIYKQINAKQQQLDALLKAGTNDALQVGQLTLDINALRKQLPIPNANYRPAALAILTAEQKTKLANLTAALQLQQPAWQAITLNLIDAPQPQPVPLPIIKGTGGGDIPDAVPAEP